MTAFQGVPASSAFTEDFKKERSQCDGKGNVPLFLFDSTSSTMDAAKLFLKHETRALIVESSYQAELSISEFSSTKLCGVFLSRAQTKGRGQHDRVWESKKDAGIFVNYLFSVSFSPEELSGLSLALSIAVSRASKALERQASFKWPNDVLCFDPGTNSYKKISGILVETLSVDGVLYISVGIGLNLTKDATGLSSAISLEEISTVDASYWETFFSLTESVCAVISEFSNTGFRSFKSLWESKAYSLGKKVRFDEEEGTIVGITERGGLIIELTSGQQKTIYSGEVHYLNASYC